MTLAKVEIPPKLIPLFQPERGALRYRGARGGRGSAKSFTFAKMAAIWGYVEPLRILCTREFQDSIKESFHAELKNAIESEPWLAAGYDVGIDYLRGHNGTEFLFKGLRHGIKSIKSTAHIDLCIVEEAEDIPEASWIALEPTIRTPKSEIWVIWNPGRDGSPVDMRLIKHPPPRSMVVEMNYCDNPWFPMELEEQRRHAERMMDPDTYAHIWLGQYLKRSKSRIFNNWRVDEFVPGSDWSGPYFGLDFGFANDPTAAIKCWIHGRRLFVEYESGGIGLELDDTAAKLIRDIPGIEAHAIRADNARPESISFLRKKDQSGQRPNLPKITAVEKGKGSVEDGISHINAYDEVIIHPRCKEMQTEFRLYSYKVDKLTGDVLPEIVDANNHYTDALRYALQPVMKSRGRGFFS